MFECIDFDEHLASFVTEYMQAHQKDYKNYDAMEADMPAIYVRFLNQPADWLDGLTPGSYFTQFEDPKDLVDWMIAYDQKGVAIPVWRIGRAVAPDEAVLVSHMWEG